MARRRSGDEQDLSGADQPRVRDAVEPCDRLDGRAEAGRDRAQRVAGAHRVALRPRRDRRGCRAWRGGWCGRSGSRWWRQCRRRRGGRGRRCRRRRRARAARAHHRRACPRGDGCGGRIVTTGRRRRRARDDDDHERDHHQAGQDQLTAGARTPERTGRQAASGWFENQGRRPDGRPEERAATGLRVVPPVEEPDRGEVRGTSLVFRQEAQLSLLLDRQRGRRHHGAASLVAIRERISPAARTRTRDEVGADVADGRGGDWPARPRRCHGRPAPARIASIDHGAAGYPGRTRGASRAAAVRRRPRGVPGVAGTEDPGRPFARRVAVGAIAPSDPRRRAWCASPESPQPAPLTQQSRRRPIFPKGCPLSIFGAGELNFRVRDGNGCGLSARVTGIVCVWTTTAAADAARCATWAPIEGTRLPWETRSPAR